MTTAAGDASRLWLLTMSAELGEEVLRLSAMEAARSHREHLGASSNDEAVRRPMASPPAIRLRITEPGFAPDYLDLGFSLVSRRAREAMELGPAEVQFLDVDATACTTEAVAKDYRALLPLRTGDPLDPATSDGGWREVHRLDGQVDRLWRLRTPTPDAGPLRIGWRDGFVAPGPLFVAPGPGWLLATDALAARMQATGLVGPAFIDLRNDGTRSLTAYR